MEKKIIFHIDVNSAFLSWTAVKMLNNNSKVDLREIPAIIGGDREKRHGIVLAKSTSAKKFGIVTGEPIANALQKCPSITIVSPEHEYYKEQSKKFINMLMEFTPDIEQVSIDECYMDFSGIKNEFESPEKAAYFIKDKIKKKLGFTVNVGISDVKVLAKMASDFTKPNRVHTLFKDEIKDKMWPLPIEELFMAGKSSVETFHKLGIFTIGELAATPIEIVTAHLKSHGKTLWEFANGIDISNVNTEKEEAKGVGNATTLPKDLNKLDEIDMIFLQLAEKVAGRLRGQFKKAKTVAVEIKYNDFTKVSRQTTLEKGVESSTEIYEISKELFRELWNNNPVRLIGIRTANLINENEMEQLSISDIMKKDKTKNIDRDKIKKLDKALDSIKNKYGNDAISRASLLKNNIPTQEGTQDER